MDQLSRINLDLLYPPFAAKIRLLVDRCNARGFHYWATCGLRTWEEQDALYAQGRTTGKPGGIVTNAKGGQSPHNFGIAIDFTLDADPDRPALQPDYDDSHYKILAEEASKLGLLSGGLWNSSFKDWPHVQWPVAQIGYSWADIRKAYRDGGGLVGVYDLLDRWQEQHGTI